MFDHVLDEDAWRINLKMLGIDTTDVPPASNSDCATSQAAHSKELFLRLREGEKKFYHDRKTDKKGETSHSVYEIMGLVVPVL